MPRKNRFAPPRANGCVDDQDGDHDGNQHFLSQTHGGGYRQDRQNGERQAPL